MYLAFKWLEVGCIKLVDIDTLEWRSMSPQRFVMEQESDDIMIASEMSILGYIVRWLASAGEVINYIGDLYSDLHVIADGITGCRVFTSDAITSYLRLTKNNKIGGVSLDYNGELVLSPVSDDIKWQSKVGFVNNCQFSVYNKCLMYTYVESDINVVLDLRDRVNFIGDEEFIARYLRYKGESLTLIVDEEVTVPHWGIRTFVAYNKVIIDARECSETCVASWVKFSSFDIRVHVLKPNNYVDKEWFTIRRV